MSLAVKFSAFVITIFLVGIVSILLLVQMIDLMSGYNDRDGDSGGVLFIFWAFIGTFTAGILSISKLKSFSERKDFGLQSSFVFAIITSTIAGILFNIVGIIAGKIFAEVLHRNL
ncbi:MAG: hypothetical protein JWN60_2373 [Acidobacteria bacterium]|nr:hypothetical protein [Acidobacteriota bacterium]